MVVNPLTRIASRSVMQIRTPHVEGPAANADPSRIWLARPVASDPEAADDKIGPPAGR